MDEDEDANEEERPCWKLDYDALKCLLHAANMHFHQNCDLRSRRITVIKAFGDIPSKGEGREREAVKVREKSLCFKLFHDPFNIQRSGLLRL